MLSPSSAEVVAATAGVVAEHAEEITRRFYPHMFEAHPELTNIFNMANQAVGEQPKALAASVVAYAVHLIDPDAPDFTPILQRVAHKHVSLGITAPQYTIVGHHLMWAIGDVLGEAVTPEVAAAWDEVYWLFALQLVAEEGKLYALAGNDPEHPWREYEVVERTQETEQIFSLLLRPVEGDLPAHRVGQYVALNVELPDGTRQPRQYTISGSPKGAGFRVTIKRDAGTDGNPEGQVSTWLFENARVGTVLEVSQPAGDVVLDDTDAPLVLVSAGVGITPMAAILEDVSQRRPQRTVRVFHADRSPQTHALLAQLEEMTASMTDIETENWYEEGAELAKGPRPARSGFMDLGDVELPQEARVFMCGSLPFMRAARTALLAQGVHPEHISYEVFGPDMWAQNPDAA